MEMKRTEDREGDDKEERRQALKEDGGGGHKIKQAL